MIAIAKRWYQLIFHVDREESPTSCLVDSVQEISMAINPSGVSSTSSWTFRLGFLFLEIAVGLGIGEVPLGRDNLQIRHLH